MGKHKKMDCHSPEHILLRASDGASDYAINNSVPEIKKFVQVANAQKLPFPDNSFETFTDVRCSMTLLTVTDI